MAEVRIQEGEPLENALRRFKRKVQQEDIIKEVKRHSFYLKPGERKRVKEALARKRNRKKARKRAGLIRFKAVVATGESLAGHALPGSSVPLGFVTRMPDTDACGAATPLADQAYRALNAAGALRRGPDRSKLCVATSRSNPLLWDWSSTPNLHTHLGRTA